MVIHHVYWMFMSIMQQSICYWELNRLSIISSHVRQHTYKTNRKFPFISLINQWFTRHWSYKTSQCHPVFPRAGLRQYLLWREAQGYQTYERRKKTTKYKVAIQVKYVVLRRVMCSSLKAVSHMVSGIKDAVLRTRVLPANIHTERNWKRGK